MKKPTFWLLRDEPDEARQSECLNDDIGMIQDELRIRGK